MWSSWNAVARFQVCVRTHTIILAENCLEYEDDAVVFLASSTEGTLIGSKITSFDSWPSFFLI